MLTFHEISVRFDNRQVLDRVSFSLRPHRMTVLLGRNGSGKSTLLRCVNQELSYTGVITDGEKNLAFLYPKERARTVAILPQTMPVPHVTWWEQAAFGRNPYLDLTGRLREKDREAVRQALEDADARELEGRFVDTLSGGERQRINLAMILAQNTPIVLLDEPTAHMDQAHEAAFLRRLNQLKQRRKKTFLLILHDLTLAAAFADDLVVLDGGTIRFSGTKEECLRQQIIENVFSVRRYAVQENGKTRLFFSAAE